jgi:hypothetical protein
MIIDIKEVLAYSKCPMFYKNKYILDKTNKYIEVSERYEEDVQKAAFAFFYKIKDREIVTMDIIKKAWGRLWINKKSSNEFIYSDTNNWRDGIGVKRREGIDALIKFYDNFKDNPGFPIAIDYRYKVKLSEALTLTGGIDLIREIDNRIEIIDFRADEKNYNAAHIANNIETTAMSLAFRKTFEDTEDSLYFYGFSKGKLHHLVKKEKDYALLKNTVECTAKCIHNKLFYCTPGEKCSTCVYNKICFK